MKTGKKKTNTAPAFKPKIMIKPDPMETHIYQSNLNILAAIEYQKVV